MIRQIKRKLLTKIITLFTVFCCISTTLNLSFLTVNAATNHYHQTFTGGRAEYQISTGTVLNSVNIDGTTFKAMSYIVIDLYLTNVSTGTIKINFSSSQISTNGLYNAANVYVYGAVINGFLQTNSFVTLKINNPTDHVQVVICLASSDLNSSLEAINTLIITPTLTTASSVDTSVQDIDVKLSGVASTLSQILTILGSGTIPITEYLDDIKSYSAYLEDLAGYIENIDNQIDTITWNTMNIEYSGYTTDFTTYDTANYGYFDPGYYVLGNPDFSSNTTPGIYKLTIPLGALSTTFSDLRFYQNWNGSLMEFTPDSYLYYPTRNFIVIYFTLNEKYHQWPQSDWPFVIKVNKRMYKYSAYSFKLQYILPDDIEYWTLSQAINNDKLLKMVNSLVAGQDVTPITDQIDNQIDDLNDITDQTQTIENDQINNLESFNNSIDLDDYNFNFDSRDGIEYFKLKLTNIFDIEEFKPFYLIPVVLFVLMAILRG